jgi:phosphoglucosamine mutase
MPAGKNLQEMASGVKKYPQTLINVRFHANVPHSNADAFVAIPAVQTAVKLAENTTGETGRVLLSKSGTEPLIRVMVEVECKTMAKTKAEAIAKAV